MIYYMSWWQSAFADPACRYPARGEDALAAQLGREGGDDFRSIGVLGLAGPQLQPVAQQLG
ncbi:hypothetical protein [Streptomyces longisporus]|uniref:Uncharacterized protein n=1 Tax=Streptomyces longisporus TaxID=1948 RepID=A0ABN3NJJ1_STRLO